MFTFCIRSVINQFQTTFGHGLRLWLIDFQVNLRVLDVVSGIRTDHEGPLRLSILGSGKSVGSIGMFGDEEIVAFNQGPLSIWTYSNTDPSQHELTTNSIIRSEQPL